MKKILLALGLLMFGTSDIGATVLRDGTGAEGKFSVAVKYLDSIGQKISDAITVTGDSLLISIWGPDGFAYSAKLQANDARILDTVVDGVAYLYFFDAWQDIDSTHGIGAYTWDVNIFDSTLGLWTGRSGTVQRTTNGLSATFDSVGLASVEVAGVNGVTPNSTKTGYSLTGAERKSITDSIADSIATAHGTGSYTTATGFSTHNAAAIWTSGTRTLTALGFNFDSTDFADSAFAAKLFATNFWAELAQRADSGTSGTGLDSATTHRVVQRAVFGIDTFMTIGSNILSASNDSVYGVVPDSATWGLWINPQSWPTLDEAAEATFKNIDTANVDSSGIGVWLVNNLLGSGADLSTNDSVLLSNLMHRIGWGTPKGSGADSSTVAERDVTGGSGVDTLSTAFQFRLAGLMADTAWKSLFSARTGVAGSVIDSLRKILLNTDTSLFVSKEVLAGVVTDSAKAMMRSNGDIFSSNPEQNLIQNPSFENDSVFYGNPDGWSVTEYELDTTYISPVQMKSGKWSLHIDGDAAGDSVFIYSSRFMLQERALLQYGMSYSSPGDSGWLIIQTRTATPSTWSGRDSVVFRATGASGGFPGFSGFNTVTAQYQVTPSDSALPMRLVVRLHNNSDVWYFDDFFAYSYPADFTHHSDSSAYQGAASGGGLVAGDFTKIADSVTFKIDSAHGTGSYVGISGGSGSGATADTTVAWNLTTGEAIWGSNITIKNLAQSSTLAGPKLSLQSGKMGYMIDDSGVILATGPGLLFTPDTTDANSSTIDTIYAIEFNPGAPTAANTCRVWGNLVDLTGSAEYKIPITFTMTEKVDDTCSDLFVPQRFWKVESLVDGSFTVDLIWSTCFEVTDYTMTIDHPKSSSRSWKLTVPNDTTFQITPSNVTRDD